MHTDPVKQVAAAIAIQDKRVLVARRSRGQKLEGFWEFPGGKLEPGESVQGCIVRELMEELGVPAEALNVFAESQYDYPGGSINLIAVEVILQSNDFSLSVHDATWWIPISELTSIDLAPADIPIANEIVRLHG